MHRRIGESHFRSGRIFVIFLARVQHFLSRDTLKHPIKMPRFHLPYVDGAVWTSDNHKIIFRSPFYGRDRKQVSGSETDAFTFRQAEQRHRVIRGHRTNAFLYSGLNEWEVRFGSSKRVQSLRCNFRAGPIVAWFHLRARRSDESTSRWSNPIGKRQNLRHPTLKSFDRT